MSTFLNIVPKRLNIVPARQATLTEAQSAPVPFDKYYRIQPSRNIQKIESFLILPAYTVPPSSVNYNGQLMFQYNVTMPAPFYILNGIVEDMSGLLAGGTLTVKWRVGTTVYRYFIHGFQRFTTNLGELIDVHTFPFYSNQLIPINCVFEFWSMPTLSITPGLQEDFKVRLNYLTDPVTADDTEIDIPALPALSNTVLGNAVPTVMPVDQTLVVFNDN